MSEPEGKLDTAAIANVNGPAGEVLDWDAISWRAVEDDVRRLRQRIFTASQAGDLKKVRNLQKLMLRSRANTLLSVRRVTEDNAGRKTAGIDRRVITTSVGKVALVDWMSHQTEPWQARPVKRVFIPKAGGKQRPLGIPVIVDRALQARVKNALEPEWEARFEPKSYGFRPGRGCHDAIEAIYQVVKGRDPKRLWVLDADLAAEAATEIQGDTAVFAGDLTRDGVCEALVETAVAELGQLDIVVNNAGYTWDGIAHRMSDEQFRAMLEIHSVVPFKVLRAAAPYLREPAKKEHEEGGEVFRKVVNVTSISGTQGNVGQVNYAAGKAALVGITKTLARVLRRPAIAPVPAFALRLLFGEMADAALLSSTRARPERLLATGFGFRFTDLESALRHVLGRPKP